jgi:septum formation inhibitor-activating ATPase MinD
MARSLAGKAYQDIADRLTGIDIPLNLKSFKPSLGTLFGKLLGIDIKAG